MITRENAAFWLPLVRALAEGKTMEADFGQSVGWKKIQCMSTNDDPSFYRIAPEPRLVPLTAEDVPALCWLRFHGEGRLFLVLAVSEGCIQLFGDNEYTFKRLMEMRCEISTDRKNWTLCAKEVRQ